MCSMRLKAKRTQNQTESTFFNTLETDCIIFLFLERINGQWIKKSLRIKYGSPAYPIKYSIQFLWMCCAYRIKWLYRWSSP